MKVFMIFTPHLGWLRLDIDIPFHPFRPRLSLCQSLLLRCPKRLIWSGGCIPSHAALSRMLKKTIFHPPEKQNARIDRRREVYRTKKTLYISFRLKRRTCKARKEKIIIVVTNVWCSASFGLNLRYLMQLSVLCSPMTVGGI